MSNVRAFGSQKGGLKIAIPDDSILNTTEETAAEVAAAAEANSKPDKSLTQNKRHPDHDHGLDIL